MIETENCNGLGLFVGEHEMVDEHERILPVSKESWKMNA